MHLGDADVTSGTGFGSTAGLRIHGKIFAMLMSDELVVKLLTSRVAELEAAGSGRRMGSGRGRPYREWIVVAAGTLPWADLVAEAREYVSRLARG